MGGSKGFKENWDWGCCEDHGLWEEVGSEQKERGFTSNWMVVNDVSHLTLDHMTMPINVVDM